MGHLGTTSGLLGASPLWRGDCVRNWSLKSPEMKKKASNHLTATTCGNISKIRGQVGSHLTTLPSSQWSP